MKDTAGATQDLLAENALLKQRIRELEQSASPQRQAEETLTIQNRTFAAVVNGLDALVYVADMKTYELIFLNTNMKKIWGDVRGQICWRTLQSGQTGPCKFCTNSQLIGADGNPAEGFTWEFQNTVTKRWYECRDRAIYWPDGRIVRMEIATDITDRKRADKELRESRTLLQTVMEGTPEPVYVKDRHSCMLLANPATLAALGKPAEQIIGKGPFDLYENQDIGRAIMEHDRLVMESGQALVMEELVPTAEGLRTFQSTKAPYRDEKGGIIGVIGVSRDITARKQAEENLRQSAEFIRGMLDTVDEGFIVIDRDYRILTANKAYCQQHARNGDEVIGRHCYEMSHRVSRPCYEEGEECAVREVFADGKSHKALHKHPGPDGQVIYVETKAFPVKDASGKVTAVIETINNITEKYLLEEERLKTQKLESIGTLAGGIAHDFNNLLQGVFGYIAMAKMTFDRKEKSLAMLEQAEKALQQSVNLTTQLLTFSKGGKPLKKPLSLPPVIENAVKFALSGSRANFQLDIDPALWRVNGDAGQLGQVIQNIVLNADQAMPLGGVVSISARNVAAGNTARRPTRVKGNQVELVIEDKGVGIPEQYLDKIFDPYFTTKEKGSGLGLATSYSIVRNHDGQILVTSKVGQGTRFSLYLPALAESSERASAGAAVPAAAPKVRVLVMDDEELIRDLVTELMHVLGNEVEVAANGEAALLKYQEAAAAGRPFDIVILDLTIRGGMGGLETVGKLAEIDPGVKAVVSSGYSDDAAIAHYREHGFQAFLKKPYNIKELNNVLHALMAE